MPGKEIVVLGSGDIGLIMARRLYFEGATIKGVFRTHALFNRLAAEHPPVPGGF